MTEKEVSEIIKNYRMLLDHAKEIATEAARINGKLGDRSVRDITFDCDEVSFARLGALVYSSKIGYNLEFHGDIEAEGLSIPLSWLWNSNWKEEYTAQINEQKKVEELEKAAEITKKEEAEKEKFKQLAEKYGVIVPSDL